MRNPDVLIIGGGIIGLASAYNLLKSYPDKSLTILEKEPELAVHQSGRNSGVLHAGIYYRPGSLKASNCRVGKAAMEEFCDRENIPYRTCGKVIVAVDAAEETRLQAIYERGRANGITCELIGPSRLRELEPYAAGIKAIYVPETGVVDFKQVCLSLADLITATGHQIFTGVKVIAIEERSDEIIVKTSEGEFFPRFIINCAGLYSDRVAAMHTRSMPAQIMPFRGEYYRLKPEAEKFCQNLIYPVPDPRFPFLGVHFTRKLSGEVKCGPNAVLALAREGYRKSEVNVQDLWESLTYPGFAKVAAKYWRIGLGEIWRSLSKAAFVTALQRLIPAVAADHLTPYPAGIRAQAVACDGQILDDFAFTENSRVVDVINAPSPGATAALSIGRTVVEKLAKKFP
jgi:(S)-2-hydroxyglutarate dehydrogenase